MSIITYRAIGISEGKPMSGNHFKSDSDPRGASASGSSRAHRPSGRPGATPSPDSTAAFIRAFNGGVRSAEDGPASPAGAAPTGTAAAGPAAKRPAASQTPHQPKPAGRMPASNKGPAAKQAAAKAANQPTKPRPKSSKRAGFTSQFPAQRDNVQFYDFGGIVPTKDDPVLVKKRKKKQGHKRPIIIGVLVAVIVILLGASGFSLYRSAKSVMADAQTAQAALTALPDKMLKGSDDLSSSVDQLTQATSRMNAQVNGPLWAAASYIPAVGSDVSAARELVSVLNDMAHNVLSPMATDLSQTPLGQLVQDGGTVNVQAAQVLADTVSKSATTIHADNERVQAITGTNVEQVTQLVEKAKTAFAALDSAASTAEKIAPVLPQMLGVGAPRSYLIVAETNSEIRTLGGFPGSMGLLTIDNGHISLGDFEPVIKMKEFGDKPTDRVTISSEEMQIFQPYARTLDYTSGDAPFIPDLPRASQLIRTFWLIKHPDQNFNSLIAADPIFLQYLLQVTGGVTASDGTEVNGTNAGKFLLSDVYWKYDGAMNDPVNGPQKQDEVFASVASAAFDKLLGNLGQLDLKQLAASVARGASEGRLIMWSEVPEEEDIYKELGVDAALPTDPAKPIAGVYLNNFSYSKIDWYLDKTVDVGDGLVNSDGTTTYPVTVKLRSTLSAEDAKKLPPYVRDWNPTQRSTYDEILGVYLYAPMGGSISDLKISNGAAFKEATHNNLKLDFGEIRLNPGESVTITYNVVAPKEAEGKTLVMRSTPTAQAARDGSAAKSAEEAAAE